VENFLIYSQIELLGADAQRIQALRKKQTAAPAKIAEIRAIQQAESVGRRGDLQLNMAGGPAAISEEYLTKIIDEVVHNAFKFSKPGAKVSVSLSATEGALVFSVTDQGRGFSTEQANKIGAYMQFERKMHEQQGLGLGLAIAKRMAELHGGSLVIQSDRGAGTTVSVKLPLAPMG